VKTISTPLGPMRSHFSLRHENSRKDVDRIFDMLQSQFAIFRYPALTWSQEQTWEVINGCICMHNMIIKTERAYSPLMIICMISRLLLSLLIMMCLQIMLVFSET
jgi:hypothetical protein